MPLDVAEVFATGNPPDDGDMRRTGANQQRGQRQANAQRNAQFEPEKKHAQPGAEQRQRIGAVIRPRLAEGLDVDHADRRDHDACRQHSKRQPGKPVCSRRHDTEHGRRRNDAGQRTLRARRKVDRRARQPAANRHPAIKRSNDIGRAQPDQLAVGINPFASLDRQRLPHRDVLHHADQRQDQRRYGQDLERIQAGNEKREGGQAFLDGADHGDAVFLVKIERHHDQGGGHDNDQRHQADQETGISRRQPGLDQNVRQPPARRIKHDQRHPANQQGHCSGLRNIFGERRNDLPGRRTGDLNAKQEFELADDDQHGGT